MEYGNIVREIYVEAPPEIVFEVVSKPEHVSQWWADEAEFESTPGGTGELVWGERVDVVPMVVVDSDPPRLFSFRWCHPDGNLDDERSLLVTFELSPSGTGTQLRLTESGFREMGWEEATLAHHYKDHISGWDTYVPQLGEYAAGLVRSL
ncbi:SRPBCC domain-containing protein [Aldersonia kunmingensis]|uniref:SRPBCC domain-containing protein n=1 Tax=Aldersonia kunmingensis TaxID=408066 RepID=UPI000830F75D|nr:SRPBCC domain-containing protein [Aldersonia kunmingensis]